MVFYWFKKILMFKLLLCFWMTFSLVPFPSAADEEVEEGMTLIYPAQYFACAWEEAYWGDAGVYWEMLFPENPPLRMPAFTWGPLTRSSVFIWTER